MNKKRSIDHREIIDYWPTVNELASDISQKEWTVQKWNTRNSIPSAHWIKIVMAAKKRGYPVNLELLAKAITEAA